MFTTSKDDKECGELRNIQYQTMLLNGAPENVCGKEDKVDNFEEFIDSQQKMNIYTPWSKMDKIAKLDRLNAYVDSLNTNLKAVSEGERLPETEKEELKSYLKTALNRKKLQRVKEVIYDKLWYSGNSHRWSESCKRSKKMFREARVKLTPYEGKILHISAWRNGDWWKL